MTKVADQHRPDVYAAFHDHVNMSPRELEHWLASEPSHSVGDTSGSSAESTGHKSGRRIVDIKRTKKADLSDADYAHMRKVVNYIKRHTAQRPAGDIADTRWRYSLMNWGHDPLKK